MNDEDIVRLFFERSEQAISALSEKYGGIFMKIALNVLGDPRDAEECVNDAYMAVWNAIPPNWPERLLPYVCRIVRNKSVSRFRESGAKGRSGYEVCIDELENLLSGGDTPEEYAEGRMLSAYIGEFLEEESETNRFIFVRRFWFMDSCADIAEAAGMKEGAVRTRLTRIKKGLRAFLKGKGVLL